MKNISVAVDGPAGAGKSSVSKAVAKDLGFVYIDTGAMYRAAALFALDRGLNPKTDTAELIKCLDELNIEIRYNADGQVILLNDKDVTGEIRTARVTAAASDVAKLAEVRKKLVKMQQEMAEKGNVIMDGRDIGTCVLPNADVKIFLTASVDARAQRRYLELKEKGEDCDYERIKQDIAARDKNDSTRSESPLRQADDAVLVDTSDMSFEQSVDRIKSMIEEKLKAAR